MAHQKHPPLSRPRQERYARIAFALVGTTCARMEELMDYWQEKLKPYAVVTVTGDHGTPRERPFYQHGSKQFSGGFAGWNDYDDRLMARNFDLALVNGNHYPAARQIVFVDPKKAGTLARRKEQLTDVAAVVFCPGAEELPEFLKRPRPQASAPDNVGLQCKLEAAGEALLPLLAAAVAESIPPIQALILAGGKSSRMGTDKGQLRYHDETTEVQRMVALCQALGLPTFLSVANAAALPESTAEGYFTDRFLGLGPLGAICTAQLNAPDAAWLVLPCDLPLFNATTLQALIAARNPGKVATAIKASDKPFPEPLAAIYEPRAYPRLLQFLGLGYACPRKMLINSDVAHLELADASPITNANTPEERAAVAALL
ncbi:MAG: NTP transferase domain-containing protein, partial [Bacteroidota bacterium]